MIHRTELEQSQAEIIAKLQKENKRLDALVNAFDMFFTNFNNRIYFVLDAIRCKENENENPDEYITGLSEMGIHYVQLTLDEAYREKAAINDILGGDHLNGK